MFCEKTSLSTASAPPAATEHSRAIGTVSEPSLAISSFKRPAAESILLALRELEQTSSAKLSDLCAGDFLSGFCSKRVTLYPLSAICHAASTPASPAPITLNFILPRPFSFLEQAW